MAIDARELRNVMGHFATGVTVITTRDTAGKPFEITLSADSKASASRGEGMVGTWKEEGNAAVIKWNTGWTTKITKDGDHYKKAAFGKGQPLDGPPANTSDAEKVK